MEHDSLSLARWVSDLLKKHGEIDGLKRVRAELGGMRLEFDDGSEFGLSVFQLKRATE